MDDGGDVSGTIVFGGAGFIGSHVLRALAAEPGRGRIVCADLAAPSGPRLENVDYVRCDVRGAIPDELAVGIDRIYNLAAVHRTPGHAPHEYYETNVAGALNICVFARRHRINQVFFTSSIAVYGPDEDLKTEATLPTPTSDYGRSKLLAEGVHEEWQAGAAERQLVIARPAVIFGAGENGNFTRLAAALKRGFFLYPGRRDTIKSCGYVGELVRSIAFTLARQEPSIVYNFCYPTRYTIEDICETFVRVAGLGKARGTVPYGLMKTAAVPFEAASRIGLRNGIDRERIAKLVTSTNIEPAYLKRSGYEFRTDLAEAIREWQAESPALV